MKVSLIVCYYGDRYRQWKLSSHFLEYQTYDNYEVIVINDGHVGKIPEMPSDKFVYAVSRPEGSEARGANIPYLKGYDLSTGDFIISVCPELIIPYDGIERMLNLAYMDRRNVARQYHIVEKHIDYMDKNLPDWRNNFDLIKEVPGIMEIETPWGYTNAFAEDYRNHGNFSGMTRKRFEKYMIPVTEEWGFGDAYTHVRELENGEPSIPIDITVFHQEHESRYNFVEYDNRVLPPPVEKSVKIKRIERSNDNA